MMKEFCTTLLNSPVIASIIEALLVCFVISRLQKKNNKELEEEKALIQHDCDIRLERYRVAFNQMLSEQHTRFDWWYLEKAKAIKTIYINLSDMRYLLQKIHSIDTDPKWKTNLEYQAETREKTYQEFLIASETNLKDWLKLRLFFDEKDDLNIANSVKEENDFLTFYVDKVTKNEIDDLAQKGPEMLYKIEKMMLQLRNDFQITLGIQKHNTEASSPQAPVDTSSKDEVKS